MKKTIHFDMDGVLANFEGRVELLCGRPFHSIPKNDMWKAVNNDPYFFLDLDLMPGALDMVRTAYLLYAGEPTEFCILSATGTNRQDEVERQKLAWLDKHLGSVEYDIFHQKRFMRNGGESKRIYANPNSLLIDDTNKNIAAWTSSAGIGILHTNSANTIDRLRKLLHSW